MEEKLIKIKTEELDQLALSYYLRQADSFDEKLRQRVTEKLEIRCILSFYEKFILNEDCLSVESESFTCPAFKEVIIGNVKKVIFYIVTVGNLDLEHFSTFEKIYADLWGSAYLDAAKEFLNLDKTYGPGLYGMKISQLKNVFKLVSGEKIKVSLNELFFMKPLKSFAGICFDTDYEEENRMNCAYCVGNRRNCNLCKGAKQFNRVATDRKSYLSGLPLDFRCDEVSGFGVAFDVGTTTVAGLLWDLESGEFQGGISKTNPQTIYGSDVISRVEFGGKNKENLHSLRKSVLDCMISIIRELCLKFNLEKNKIVQITAAGNTVMSHIIAGFGIKSLAFAPFEPAYKGIFSFLAATEGFDVNNEAEVKLIPNIAGYVGGDITAGLLACGFYDDKRTKIFIDLGTNGEIAVSHEGRVLTCSTAAGPAFESGRMDGATMIHGISEMLKTGEISSTGKLTAKEGKESFFGISQLDIRALQLAKGAIYAGILVLLSILGVKVSQIENVFIAGVFGSFLNIDDAVNIGLLPNISLELIEYVGNAAGTGTSMCLLSHKWMEKADAIPEKTEHIELANQKNFQDLFLKSMDFNPSQIL